jgi:hypothetical protein
VIRTYMGTRNRLETVALQGSVALRAYPVTVRITIGIGHMFCGSLRPISVVGPEFEYMYVLRTCNIDIAAERLKYQHDCTIRRHCNCRTMHSPQTRPNSKLWSQVVILAPNRTNPVQFQRTNCVNIYKGNVIADVSHA